MPMERDLIRLYEQLHDRLSDMIENGRLTAADIPDDYSWLVKRLSAAEKMKANMVQPFALVVWAAPDIITHMKNAFGMDISVEQAEDWLGMNEGDISDLMVERGWSYISDMCSPDDFEDGDERG